MTRATHASSQPSSRQPGGGVPPAWGAPEGEVLGVTDGVLDGDGVGVTGSGGPDGGDSVGVGDPVGDSDGEGELDDGSGDALPWLEPTCAGGGNASTGLPARAVFIICCQVSAGRPAP